MRALVVGYGSIGRRHARLLATLGCEVSVVSRGDADPLRSFRTIREGLAGCDPGYVVIANRTSEHRAALASLADEGFRGMVLVEKPLFDRPAPIPPHAFDRAAVAYNLRFHPLVARLRALVADARNLVSVHVHSGSYLPDWRPDSDYRAGYSARRTEGGGVLRDLSHELDYTLWMLGPWKRLTASGGHFSDLEIDSDDVFSLILETERCPLVTMTLSYVDRMPRRDVLVNSDRGSIRVDLIANTISVDGIEERVDVDRDDTYVAEHTAMLSGGGGLCTLEEGAQTVLAVAAAERASAGHAWITP